MMGCEGEGVHQSGSGWSPVFVEDNLSVMSAGFLLSSPGQAFYNTLRIGLIENTFFPQMLQ